MGVNKFLFTGSKKITTLTKSMTKKTINPGLIMHDIEGPICFKPQNIYQKPTNQGCALHVPASLGSVFFYIRLMAPTASVLTSISTPNNGLRYSLISITGECCSYGTNIQRVDLYFNTKQLMRHSCLRKWEVLEFRT